jgi:hypothetical protein
MTCGQRWAENFDSVQIIRKILEGLQRFIEDPSQKTFSKILEDLQWILCGDQSLGIVWTSTPG